MLSPKSRCVATACAEHARPRVARVSHDGCLEHAAAATHGVDGVGELGGVGASAASAAMRPKRESAARSAKPPTSICARRNTSLHRLLIEKQYSSCCRSCATASNLGHWRRNHRLAATAARAPRAVAARRRAIGVAVATRAHQQPAGRRPGSGRGLVQIGFQIGRLGAPHLLSPARARYSWSAGFRWAWQSHLLRHHSAKLLDNNLPALRF